MLGSRYKKYLLKQGHQVILTENGQDAVLQADAMRPDIVLMELLLANHSGVEFIYEFRSYTEWQNIPIVVLSRLRKSQVFNDDNVLKELGINAYMYKPETSLKRLQERLDALEHTSIIK